MIAKRVMALRHATLLIALAVAAFALSLMYPPSRDLTAFFLARQDRWLLLLEASLLSIIVLCARRGGQPLVGRAWLPWAVASGLAGLCAAGHFWVLDGYDLSRDEQMANFDAWVFGHGHLIQPLPALWRDNADALNTLFMYDAVHRGGWVSSYLPFNALLRAAVGQIASPVLTGGLLTAIALLALWGCARRIWPQDREAPVLALLMFVSSGQILVTGMTAYAMPGHLALNLVWLWFFLRCSLWADVIAIFVAFMAMGLHQPLMHPLFAGPFFLLLWRQRNWQRLALFVAGYGAAGGFWLWWPGHIWALTQADLHAVRPAGVDFMTRLLVTIREGDPQGLQHTASNLLRFVAWQNLALLPLMALGWRVARTDRLAEALALGAVLTVAVMAVILPYQGHGFGYRYLHGLIGNCILLAVFGWQSVQRDREIWRDVIRWTAMAGCLVIIPLQFWMAHGFYAPAASVNARINRVNADYVIIGYNDAPFSRDLIYNQPDLKNRPVRLLAEALNRPLIASLCAGGSKAFLVDDAFLAPMAQLYAFTPSGVAGRRKVALSPLLRRSGCVAE